MAKINVIGDALVITSELSVADIETLEKYNPRALKLYEENEDGKKEEVFTVCLTKGNPGLNSVGASFAADPRTEKTAKATITTMLGRCVGDKVLDYVTDTYGRALQMLEKVEAQIPAALADAKAFKEGISAKITIA